MVSFIFPGQGSQYVGMGEDLFNNYPEARQVFKQADEVLGFSLSKLCFSGPQNELTQTNNCQPAILTMSIAAWEVFKSIAPGVLGGASFVAGLSLGEYSALVAANALSFEDGLRLVRKRAELMEEAAEKHSGKMAAVIGLSREDLLKICSEIDGVTIANLNCPGQVVVSGRIEAVDKAKERASEGGAKRVVDLEVSGAFHSSLMREAADQFRQALDAVKFKRPEVLLVSNVDALAWREPAKIKENLEKQIFSSVLWEDSMRFIISNQVAKFYEIGPGRVLKGLMRKIDPQVEVVNVEKKEDLIKLGGQYAS